MDLRRLSTAILLLTLGAGTLLAQGNGDPAPPPGDPANTAKAEPAAKPTAEGEAAADDDSILGLVMKSGITGWVFLGVLAIFSLVAATIAIERFAAIRRGPIVPAGFSAQLTALLARDDATIDELQTLCRTTPSPAARILEAGLLRAGRPPMEVEKAMEDAAAREMADIRSRVRPLGVIGGVAPLVGLLGTVLGMIVSFRTASEAGLGKGGEVMAQGIYLALLTTAAGLSIAIPAMMLAAHFNGKVERLFREIDVQLMPVLPTFARFEREATPLPERPLHAESTPSDNGNGEMDESERPLAAAKG